MAGKPPIDNHYAARVREEVGTEELMCQHTEVVCDDARLLLEKQVRDGDAKRIFLLLVFLEYDSVCCGNHRFTALTLHENHHT